MTRPDLDPTQMLDFGRGPETAVLRRREGKRVWVSLAENNIEIIEILDGLRNEPNPPEWNHRIRVLPSLKAGSAG